MEDKKKINEMTLDTAVLVHGVIEHLYKKGIIAFWPTAVGGTVQMTKKAFLSAFDKYAVNTYPGDGGGYGAKAYTDYNGVRFFTLLDNEEAADV